MSHVVLLIGLPATGKFTVGTELVRQMEQRGMAARLVDNHHWNNVIFPLVEADGKRPQPPDVWQRILEVGEAVWTTMEELSPPEWNFVLTGAITSTDELWIVDRIATLARRRNSDYTVVELTCDVDELAERVHSPARAARHKMTNVDGIRELHAGGTPPIDRDVLVIDTTDRRPAETARLILVELVQA
jgi:hypothetical protein